MDDDVVAWGRAAKPAATRQHADTPTRRSCLATPVYTPLFNHSLLYLEIECGMLGRCWAHVFASTEHRAPSVPCRMCWRAARSEAAAACCVSWSLCVVGAVSCVVGDYGPESWSAGPLGRCLVWLRTAVLCCWCAGPLVRCLVISFMLPALSSASCLCLSDER